MPTLVQSVCLALALVLGTTGVTRAGDLYVRSTGSDANDGSSPVQAFRTVQRAADAAGPGDTVHLMAGTYVESVRVFTSGTAGAPIVFTPYGDGPVVMDGQNIGCPGGVRPRPDGLHQAFWIAAGGHDVVIEGLEVTRYCYHGIALALTDRATVRDCYVHHNGLDLPAGLPGAGIAAYGPAADVLIERNVVTDNVPENDVSGSGIVANVIDRVTIRDNVATRNHGNGILLEDCTAGLVERNVASFNVGDFGTWGTAGLWLDGGHDVTVRNNWFEGNVWAGMEITDETPSDPYGYVVHDNVAVGNRFGLWLDGIGRDGAAPNLVYNNTVVDSTAIGLWVSRFTGFDLGAVSPLRNTTIVNNVSAQLTADAPALAVDAGVGGDVVVDYNLYYRAASTTPVHFADTDLSFAAYQAASGWDGSGDASDPAFANAGLQDYHLLAASPGVDAGSPTLAPAADFDGKPRPFGTRVDLGAFEYGTTTGDVVVNWLETVPAVIETGAQATLTWSTWQAAQVSIDPGVGLVNAVGSVTVNPSTTTTYTLTADGGGGPASMHATVTVVDPNPHCAGPASLGNARLELRKRDQPGRASLTITTHLAFTEPLSPHAPARDGVRIIVTEGPLGQTVDRLDLDVPGGPKGGPEGCASNDGWKVNGDGTTFGYVNKSGAIQPPTCVPGSAAGVGMVRLKDRVMRGGGVDLKVTGKGGGWTLTGAGDVMVTLSLDDGSCQWVRFEPAECVVSPTSVSCRQ